MKMTINFAITHQISSSKGWGRYKASTAVGPLVQSSTGNAWVSAPHAGEAEEGTEFSAILQTAERTKKGRETVQNYSYRLVAKAGAVATIGHWNGLEVVVSGAEVIA